MNPQHTEQLQQQCIPGLILDQPAQNPNILLEPSNVQQGHIYGDQTDEEKSKSQLQSQNNEHSFNGDGDGHGNNQQDSDDDDDDHKDPYYFYQCAHTPQQIAGLQENDSPVNPKHLMTEIEIFQNLEDQRIYLVTTQIDTLQYSIKEYSQQIGKQYVYVDYKNKQFFTIDAVRAQIDSLRFQVKPQLVKKLKQLEKEILSMKEAQTQKKKMINLQSTEKIKKAEEVDDDDFII